MSEKADFKKQNDFTKEKKKPVSRWELKADALKKMSKGYLNR